MNLIKRIKLWKLNKEMKVTMMINQWEVIQIHLRTTLKKNKCMSKSTAFKIQNCLFKADKRKSKCSFRKSRVTKSQQLQTRMIYKNQSQEKF